MQVKTELGTVRSDGKRKLETLETEKDEYIGELTESLEATENRPLVPSIIAAFRFRTFLFSDDILLMIESGTRL